MTTATQTQQPRELSVNSTYAVRETVALPTSNASSSQNPGRYLTVFNADPENLVVISGIRPPMWEEHSTGRGVDEYVFDTTQSGNNGPRLISSRVVREGVGGDQPKFKEYEKFYSEQHTGGQAA